jgi:aminoglycoside/choline kinase family phosphotransferase
MPPVTAATEDPRLVLLRDWLNRDLGMTSADVSPASADASFRRYFRVLDGSRSLIVMDAPPEREDVGPFVRVAAALGEIGVLVPRVLAEERSRGFLLLTDLGTRPYLPALADPARVESLYYDATEALLTIQSRGAAAAAGLACYGVALLDRDVQLLPEWFLGRHLGAPPSAAERDLIERTSARLAGAALEQPQVFVHRDYHSRNLMVVEAGNPGILDFQDAVRGAVTYDLVSLFKDCYVAWPRDRVLGWVRDYRRRAQARGIGVGADDAEFIRWFDLMGLQRHLKVLGIFARLWYRDGKSAYLHDLPTVLAYVLETTALYGELQELDAYLRATVLPRFAAAQAQALGS